MKYRLLLIISISLLSFKYINIEDKKIVVACIGDSITYGGRVRDPDKESYPAQLQALLGNKYIVNNYGVKSATLLRKGNVPYWKTKEYQSALNSHPDIVFIKLGTNDTKLINRVHFNEFIGDYKDMVQSFKQLPSHPRVVLLLPVPSFNTDTALISDSVNTRQIIPRIQRVAYDLNIEVVDLHMLLINKPELLPDKVHPDAAGLTIIANRLSELIKQDRDTTYDIFDKIKFTKKISSFYGYPCADFTFNGRNCKIVKPKWTAKKHPWVWRARFWGHEPQTDIALLERGFHIVYCDVIELFGNREAVELWNNYYAILKKAGLSKKTVLEGMSRGGLYIYNWAAENPKKVACVYADNPVLDLKSWPGGKGRSGGSKADWAIFKKDYNLTNEEDISSFSNSPIDKVPAIVKGRYPMLHVCGDADEIVPMEENTVLFEQKVKELGGDITVIHKPNGKHHPHSLPNPTPILDFILKVTNSTKFH